MSFTIDISGNIKDIFNKRTRALEAQIKDELNAAGQMIVNDAKRGAPVNEGHLRNSITYTQTVAKRGFEVKIIVATDYAAYVEFGTRGFAARYVATLPKEWQEFARKYKGPGGGSFDEFVRRIYEWVRKKGIKPNQKQYEQGDSFSNGKLQKPRKRKKVDKEQGQQQLAYAIAIKIMREGIKPQPFLFPAVEKGRIELLKRIKALK